MLDVFTNVWAHSITKGVTKTRDTKSKFKNSNKITITLSVVQQCASDIIYNIITNAYGTQWKFLNLSFKKISHVRYNLLKFPELRKIGH